uniref:DUF2921 domain-containing protein n=1 Tax=Quercus lobata TaxID=97700 RepID=A0A7N2LK48_QUELO
MGSNSCSSSSSSLNPKKLKFTLSLFLCFLFLFLNFPTTTAFFRKPFRKPEISYSQHCNDVDPEPPLSSDNVPVSHSNDFHSFQFAFFSGSVGIFNRTSESRISLSFNPSYIKNTTSHGVHKVKATLNIRDPWKYSVFGRRRLGRISYRKDDSVFSVNGYWSESSGKLCMVGSGKSYVGSFSSKYPDVVLKLTVQKIIAFMNPDYEYALVDKIDCLSAQEGGGDINLSPSKLDHGVCSVFSGQTSDYDLHYWSDCGSVNCNPLRGSIEYLPSRFAYRGVRCDQRSRKDAWDEKENKFCGVACRILANASVGDCSIGFSLRFPAVISLRNSSSIVGEIWSKKDVKDSGYFGRIGFQSWGRPIDPQGLRYEYTEIEAVRNSCTQGVEIVRGKGKTYPDGFSLDMGFGILVKNTEGKVTSGFLRPQFVGDVLYVHQDELKSNHSRMLNMSFRMGFKKAEIAKGTIESRRSKTDPLYFERLQIQ